MKRIVSICISIIFILFMVTACSDSSGSYSEPDAVIMGSFSHGAHNVVFSVDNTSARNSRASASDGYILEGSLQQDGTVYPIKGAFIPAKMTFSISTAFGGFVYQITGTLASDYSIQEATVYIKIRQGDNVSWNNEEVPVIPQNSVSITGTPGTASEMFPDEFLGKWKGDKKNYELDYDSIMGQFPDDIEGFPTDWFTMSITCKETYVIVSPCSFFERAVLRISMKLNIPGYPSESQTTDIDYEGSLNIIDLDFSDTGKTAGTFTVHVAEPTFDIDGNLLGYDTGFSKYGFTRNGSTLSITLYGDPEDVPYPTIAAMNSLTPNSSYVLKYTR
ncbi:hypothetical protein [Breznakiella homolactica]|uniref:Uncharacterized protein n=1 Tax=Breznakiella homolactica TaxID=2798577 RepID=A0A7T8BAX0_9SPIR|nr:hypothetical protein [Breznakiella homolactica]QQO11194.1 hypothetical protein JFL75_09875 [Breznakiella homolactica]